MRPRLSSFELRWVDAAFDAIFPPPPRSVLAHGVLEMHPASFFDDLLAKIPLEQSIGLRVTLWMVALAPLFTIRKLATIASASEGDRTRVLERLLTSPIYVVRQLATSLKAMATLLYAQSSVVRAQMNAPRAVAEADAAGLVSVRVRKSSAYAGAPSWSAEPRGGSHDHAAE